MSNCYRTIELFAEKTGRIVRKIRFRNQRDFDEFLKGFRSMRYPGYNWRYLDKEKKDNE
ncbi:MAG: hypothetical protein JSV67_06780 [Thermoplasmatales archaeon]|nr:MAG: hypothetical protein JSV67_06780 [Thermoplasmatales archaeon]